MAAKGGSGHAVRAQTFDLGSNRGTFSFRVNGGTAGDVYRLWVGNVCVFSSGPSFQGSNPTLQYNDNGPRQFTHNGISLYAQDINFAYSGHGWRTSGAASNGDDDLFEISFGPGLPTTHRVTPEHPMMMGLDFQTITPSTLPMGCMA